jgi:hypothetical protein
MFQVHFAKKETSSESDNIFKLFKSGILNATSVGFMPLAANQPKDENEREALGLGKYGVEFTKQNLWELSAVGVPSNPNALVVNSAELAECCKSVGITNVVIEDKSPKKEDIIKSLEEKIEVLTEKVSNLEKLISPDDDDQDQGGSTQEVKEPDADNIYDLLLEGINEKSSVKQIIDNIQIGGQNDT